MFQFVKPSRNFDDSAKHLKFCIIMQCKTSLYLTTPSHWGLPEAQDSGLQFGIPR